MSGSYYLTIVLTIGRLISPFFKQHGPTSSSDSNGRDKGSRTSLGVLQKRERRGSLSYRALLNSYQVWLLFLSKGEGHLISERLRQIRNHTPLLALNEDLSRQARGQFLAAQLLEFARLDCDLGTEEALP